MHPLTRGQIAVLRQLAEGCTLWRPVRRMSATLYSDGEGYRPGLPHRQVRMGTIRPLEAARLIEIDYDHWGSDAANIWWVITQAGRDRLAEELARRDRG